MNRRNSSESRGPFSMSSTKKMNRRNSSESRGGLAQVMMMPVLPAQDGSSAFAHTQNEQLMVPQAEFGLPVVTSASTNSLGGLVVVASMLPFNLPMQPRRSVPKPAVDRALLLTPHIKNASSTNPSLLENFPVLSPSFLPQAHMHMYMAQQHSLCRLQEQSMLRQQHQNIPVQPRRTSQLGQPQPAKRTLVLPTEESEIPFHQEPNHRLQRHRMQQSILRTKEQQGSGKLSQMLRQSRVARKQGSRKDDAQPHLSQRLEDTSGKSKVQVPPPAEKTHVASDKESDFAPQIFAVTDEVQAKAADTTTSAAVDTGTHLGDYEDAKRSNLYRLLEAASVLQDESAREVESRAKQKAKADVVTNFSTLQDVTTKPRSTPTDSQSSSKVSSSPSVTIKKQRSKRKKSQGDSNSSSVRKKAKSATKIGAQKSEPICHEQRTARTFPQKLMDVLMNVSNDEDTVAWLPDGKSFVIVDPDHFVAKYLPHAFKKCKYMSFTRKLNRWGFVRMTSGTGTDCFHHPFFQKGRVDLCLKMLSVRGKDEEQLNAAKRRLENKRKIFTANGKGGAIRGSSSKGVNKPPSLMGLEKFIKKKEVPTIAERASSIHKPTTDGGGQIKQN